MGTLWYKSRSVEWYQAEPADGAKAHFFRGDLQGVPISIYQDGQETTPHTNPVLADGNGRWPAVFIPYMTSYGVRVTTENDVQLWLDTNIPNPDPQEISVDAPVAQIITTGMIHFEINDGVKTGYVRCNGRTIGNENSGATEMAHPTATEALFIYLWNNTSNTQCPVIPGGHGDSAEADFDGNKQMTLPDLRGGGPIGLDTMGAAAAGSFTGLTFTNGSGTLPGSRIGANFYTLTTAQMPAHTHSGTANTSGSHTHGAGTGVEIAVDGELHTHLVSGFTVGTAALQGAPAGSNRHTHSATIQTADGAHTHTGTTGTVPGGAPDGSHQHTYNNRTSTVSTSGAATIPGFWNSDTNTITSGDSTHVHGVNIPSSGAHTHTITIGQDSADHRHSMSFDSGEPSHAHTHSIPTGGEHTHTITINSTGGGAGSTVNNLSREVLGTWYIKL